MIELTSQFEVRHQTARAALVYTEASGEFWVPKSQSSCRDGKLFVSEWIFGEKNLARFFPQAVPTPAVVTPMNTTIPTNAVPVVADGVYTVVFNGNDDDYRTIRIRTPKNKSYQKVGIMEGSSNEKFTYIGHLRNGRIQFWSEPYTPARIQEQVTEVYETLTRMSESEVRQAGKNYAIRASRCYKCNRQLTVPISVHEGMGPECAGRNR